MALTRKMLQAMDIPAEKIDEIISAHSETVNAIKTERDELKADAEKLVGVEKALEKATQELEKFKADDWEAKYNTLKGEYDSYKTDTETRATKAAKEMAYKQILLDAGIPEKRTASILKVTNMDGVELDKDGKLKDAEKLAETVKSEWADFVQQIQEKGADVPKPPANDGQNAGQNQPSRAAQMAAAYRNEHYGNPKED